MTNHVMLNNIAHKDLRVITRYSAEFGDNVGTVLTFPTEYGDTFYCKACNQPARTTLR